MNEEDIKILAELKNKLSTQRTIEVPVEILEDIIYYCEYNAIYDKLTNFGDFYYKLKQLL